IAGGSGLYERWRSDAGDDQADRLASETLDWTRNHRSSIRRCSLSSQGIRSARSEYPESMKLGGYRKKNPSQTGVEKRSPNILDIGSKMHPRLYCTRNTMCQ